MSTVINTQVFDLNCSPVISLDEYAGYFYSLYVVVIAVNYMCILLIKILIMFILIHLITLFSDIIFYMFT